MSKDFFSIGKETTDKIATSLNELDLGCSLLVGGGYAYNSIKYKDNGKIGDLDYICVLRQIEDIEVLLRDKELLKRFGYDIDTIDKVYKEDIEFFNQKIVSIIRFSGLINSVKASINFTTYSRLESIFYPNYNLYKAIHGKSQNIIVSKGSDGGDVILCMVSPEVSKLYNDQLKHYFIPDIPWYKNGSAIYTGVITDFIGKGIIVLDEDNQLFNIQQRVLEYLVKNSTQQIADTGSWFKMFASSDFFSKNFKLTINKKLESIYQSLQPKLNEAKAPLSNALMLQYSSYQWYNPKYLSDQSLGFENRTGKVNVIEPLQNLLEQDTHGLLTHEQKLHIINAECKRLTVLLQLASSYTSYAIPKSMRAEDLLFDVKTDEFIYANNILERQDILTALVKSTDLMFTEDQHANSLSAYIVQLRTALILHITKVKELNMKNLEIGISQEFIKYIYETSREFQ